MQLNLFAACWPGLIAQYRHKDFLRQVDLDLADDASRIPVDRYAALYNLLNRTFDDEAFCLFAQPMRVGSFEFLCRGSLSAPLSARRWHAWAVSCA